MSPNVTWSLCMDHVVLGHILPVHPDSARLPGRLLRRGVNRHDGGGESHVCYLTFTPVTRDQC